MWMTRQELTVAPWICLAMDFYGDFADRIGQGKKITMSRILKKTEPFLTLWDHTSHAWSTTIVLKWNILSTSYL